MRSAVTSGVGANGLGAGEDRADNRHFDDTTRRPARRLQRMISSVTTAVALTALLSAALFVIYDTTRTLDDLGRDVATIASDLAASGPDAIGASTFVQAGLAGSHDGLAMDVQTTQALTGVGQRAGIAFALAGLLTALTFRRRKGDMPDLQQRQNYRTMAAAIPMGVACWTKAGALVVCNEQYRERLDLSSMSVTYHDAVKRLIQGGYMKLIHDDDSSRLLELHRKDGSCLLIDERPLDDGGFMTLVSDVTERKKTDTLLHSIREEQRLLARRYHEEKLKAEAASHAKTNFLAHLSHDIRTPLNHIIGFAELMRHQTYGPLGDARYADYVQSIKTSGEHLLASFATILDLAELDSGQKALRTDPVLVDDVIDSVIKRFHGQATRSGLRFVRSAPSRAEVSGDRMGLVRMVANIVENSLRFTPPGGRVILAAFASHDGVVIEVTDSGVGMSEERLASLSQPFALGDATFTREGIGPGLGISISRAIAELSGGCMAIDSSPALGTTVAISLPLRTRDALVAA